MHTQNLSRLLRRIQLTVPVFYLITTLCLAQGSLAAADPDHSQEWDKSEVQEAAPAWQPRLDKDGIKVSSRPYGNGKHQEFHATTIMEAAPASIIAVLQDNAVCPRWLYRCQESRLLEEVSNQERYFYQVTDLPFPARSRDAVFHAVLTWKENGNIRVALKAIPDYLEETRNVRIQESVGYYLVEPVDDTHTRVTWQQYINPAGSLPAWLVNSMLTDLPFESLKALKTLVGEAPYRSAVFSYDEAGLPSGIVLSP